MNSTQRVVLIAGCVAFAVVGLLAPPAPGPVLDTTGGYLRLVAMLLGELNLAVVFIRWAIVAALTAAAFLAAGMVAVETSQPRSTAPASTSNGFTLSPSQSLPTQEFNQQRRDGLRL